jgi:hypothetical protein
MLGIPILQFDVLASIGGRESRAHAGLGRRGPRPGDGQLPGDKSRRRSPRSILSEHVGPDVMPCEGGPRVPPCTRTPCSRAAVALDWLEVEFAEFA